MKGLYAVLLVTLLLIGLAGQAVADVPAVQIFYDRQNLGGTRWVYTYTVVNNSLSYIESDLGTDIGITYFDIYFPTDSLTATSESLLFSNFVVTDAPDPQKWYVFVEGPPSRPWSWPVWKFDAYATTSDKYDPNQYIVTDPIFARDPAERFSVAFDYSGSGAPVDQQFTVNNLYNLQPIFTGTTEPYVLVADAGPNQTVQAGAVVHLDGSNSTSSTGIASYQWAQLPGPTVILSDPTAVQPTFTAPAAGLNGASLQFQLTVTDRFGRTSQATCTVTVTSANQPPEASAGSDQTVRPGDQVTLNGSGSTDPDGRIISYVWQQTDGLKVQLSDPASVSPTFTAPMVGTGVTALTFKVTVTDNGGLTATATCIVNVAWVNQPPVANAGQNQTVNGGDPVTLDGSASTDPDDGIASYLWTQLSGPPVTLSSTSAAQRTFTAPYVPRGDAMLTFQLTVTDKGGLQSSATCSVTVQWVDTPPVVNTGNNVFILSEDQATTVITGTATDADGDSLAYTWFEGNTPLASGQVGPSGAAPLNLALVPPLPIGAHTLTLVVNDGYATAMGDMILTIDNSPPTVVPTGEGAYEIKVPVTLGGQASDYDGDVVNYTWLDGTTALFTGSVQTVAGGTPVNLLPFTTSGLSIGVHAITLQATDGVNKPVTQKITVTVIDTMVPTLAPVASQSILWPPDGKMVPITIQANAADNDGLPVVLTVTIACNESGTGFWTTPAINQTTGVISLSLQAARAGNNKDGRQYTITITATGQSGIPSTTNVKIVVPHDQGKK